MTLTHHLVAHLNNTIYANRTNALECKMLLKIYAIKAWLNASVK